MIPNDVAAQWAEIGKRGAGERYQWEVRLDQLSDAKKAQSTFERKRDAKKQLSEDAPKVATRKASEMALAAINPVMPETIGGSADLTGSNNTLTKDLGTFDVDSRKGRYVYYGIREHGMAAAMNGLALHGGCMPYGGTFLCFADYARGAMRLSALMGAQVTYVMTHDSIWARTAPPTSRSSMWRCCARRRTCTCSAPPTRSRPPRPGSWR